MSFLRFAVAALVLFSGSAAWGAECAPQKMVKVVYQNATPGQPPAAMAMSTTMHRLTERYGRVEQSADPAGRRNLMVVAEPDVWMADLTAKTGQYMLDPGPVLEFRAPIFNAPGTPPLFAKVETGCELEFMDTYAPKASGQVKVDGQTFDRHQVSLGADRIEMLMKPGVREIYSISHYQGASMLMSLRYIEYAIDLTPDMSLFAKPAGVTFSSPPAAKR